MLRLVEELPQPSRGCLVKQPKVGPDSRRVTYGPTVTSYVEYPLWKLKFTVQQAEEEVRRRIAERPKGVSHPASTGRDAKHLAELRARFFASTLSAEVAQGRTRQLQPLELPV